MVWSQLSIVVHFGIHFGNSVLDNSNRDKVSHSLTPICGRWGTTQNFILAFIDELWKTWKIRLLKNEKICWTYHFTHVYQKPITWGTVSEIWIETAFFVILGLFMPFWPPPLPPNNPENQNFETKKSFGDVIILHFYNKKHYHLMYAYSDMKCSHNFLSFQASFCSFAPLSTLKIKILKKYKKTPGDIFLHMCTINQDHMHPWYGSSMVPEIWSSTDRIIMNCVENIKN